MTRLASDYPLPGGTTEKEYFARVSEWLVMSFRTMGEANARMFVDEAMSRSIPQGKRPWNPKSGVPFPVHVARIALNCERSARRRRGRHGEVALLEDHDESPDSEPDAEARLLAAERQRRLGAALREEFKDSPAVLPWLAMVLRGEVTDDQIAGRSGFTTEQIYKARARVKAFVDGWYEAHGPDVDSGKWEAQA